MGTTEKKDGEVEVITPPPINFDQLLENLGGFGRFQLLTLVLLLSLEIPVAFLSFVPIFTGASPSFWLCDGEVISSKDACDCNGTLTSEGTSIVAEWNLVCDKAWVSDFITSLQMTGMVFGCIAIGKLADWYGRKTSFLATILTMAIGSVVSAVAPNPYLYAFARFLCGAGLAGYLGITSIYTMEFQTPRWRPLCGAVGPWGEGIIILAAMAYYIKSWRMLTLATAMPFLLIAVIYPLLPESPRWLLRNQKTKEAHKVINTIARMNGKEKLSLEFVEKLAALDVNPNDDVQRFSYWDFVRQKQLRLPSLYLMGIWAAWSITNFGIAFNIKNFPGNIYWNVVLLGATDAVGYPASLLISNKVGRRQCLALFMSGAAVFLVAVAVVDLSVTSDLRTTLVVVLCLLGKLGISGARGCVRTITGETYPTAIRSMGACICGVSSGLGSIVAPQLAFLGSSYPSIPFFTFAAISVAGALICFLLNETQGQALKDEVLTNPEPQDCERANSNLPIEIRWDMEGDLKNQKPDNFISCGH